MSCQCHQIGGRFIAEDPDCPAHGTAAQAERDRERDHRDVIIRQLSVALRLGSPASIERAALSTLEYLQSL